MCGGGNTLTLGSSLATHKSFSRIDLAYMTAPVLPRVRDITILPRGISDHAPLLLSLELATETSDRLWRLSRFWVTEREVEPQFHDTLRQFWTDNSGTGAETSVWDGFKASSRGQYQSIIAAVRGDRRAELEEVEDEALKQEALYVRSREPQHFTRLQSLTQKALLLRMSLTQKKLLHQTQRIFEQGEKTGHLLARLSKEQSEVMTIAQIQGQDGVLLSHPRDTNQCFTTYYQQLYSSRVTYDQKDLDDYLEETDIPILTITFANTLDAPITIEEIQSALKIMQTGKTPGPDGFPVEFYKTYMEDLAP